MKNCKIKGFSMLEMIIVIGIIAVLATLITPLAVNYISQKRYDTCNDELKIIKQAIVGDPNLIEGGTRSSFGFVGDLGVLPASLNDLLVQGSMPTWTTVSNVQFGWRGPYISEIKDPWGNNYVLKTNWTGRSGTEIIMIDAFGQDGIDDEVNGNDDDVSIIIREDEAFSRISGNTLDQCGAGAGFTNIRIFYPNLSTVTSISINTLLASPHYSTGLIPIGIRYISVDSPAMNKLIYINNGPVSIVNLRTPGVCN